MGQKKTSFMTSVKKHPILWNVAFIFVALAVLCFLALCFFDVWTHHGSTTVVPDVIGMRYSNATEILREADLEVVISDSVYSKDRAPGSVVDVIPQPNSVVKAGREVYVTIVAFAPEPIMIDMLLTDISWKQAEAYLKSKGLRVEKVYVPSQYPDLVMNVKCNGRNLVVGSQVTVDDVVVLEVGKLPEHEYESEDPLDLMINAALNLENDTTALRETENTSSSSVSEQVKNVFGVE